VAAVITAGDGATAAAPIPVASAPAEAKASPVSAPALAVAAKLRDAQNDHLLRREIAGIDQRLRDDYGGDRTEPAIREPYIASRRTLRRGFADERHHGNRRCRGKPCADRASQRNPMVAAQAPPSEGRAFPPPACERPERHRCDGRADARCVSANDPDRRTH
jgi:hypothetical protein